MLSHQPQLVKKLSQALRPLELENIIPILENNYPDFYTGIQTGNSLYLYAIILFIFAGRPDIREGCATGKTNCVLLTNLFFNSALELNPERLHNKKLLDEKLDQILSSLFLTTQKPTLHL